MKVALHILKEHPISMFFYALYILLWYRTYQINHLAILDGGLLDFFGLISAIIFIAICLFYSFKTKQFRFYLCLIALIIAPIIVIVYN